MKFCKLLLAFPLLLLITILTSAQLATAQSSTVEGRVILADTGEPIANVNVSLESTSQGAVTDGSGEFVIENVDAGRYTIVVTFVGYEDVRRVIRVLSEQKTRLNVRINQSAAALSEVTVVGERRASYVAERNAIATKLDVPQNETPRSVSVVTSEAFQERGAQSVSEAVRYSSRVNTGKSGFDPRFDQLVIRGLSATTTGDYKDGLRQPYASFGTFLTEPYNLQRIEVLKGPSSSIFGQSSIGGMANRVTKRPSEKKQRQIRSRYATDAVREIAYDQTGPIANSEEWLYRIVTLGREGEGNRQIANDRLLAAPSLTWQPTRKTELTLLGQFQYSETDASVANIQRDGEATEVRASDPGYDSQKVTQFQIGYDFDHRFSTRLSVGQNVRFGYFDLDSRYLTSAVSDGGFNDSGEIFRRGATAIVDEFYALQADNFVKMEFEISGTSHRVMTGLDYLNYRSEFGLGRLATQEEFALDFDDPEFGVEGPTPDITSRTNTDPEQVGVYLRDYISMGRVRVSLGIRNDWFDRETTDAATSEVESRTHVSDLTGDAALLYAFESGLSPYVSYATAFEATNRVGAEGNVLAPITGRQYEVGVKYAPPQRNFQLAIAAFQITQKNVPRFAGSNEAGIFYESIGEIQNSGVELEGRASLNSNLVMTAAYNYLDSDITAALDSQEVGNTPSATPEQTASLWIGYTLNNGSLAGLGLDGGVRYRGESYKSRENNETNEAATYIDAAIDYRLGAINQSLQGLSVGINATNITDRKREICTGGFCYLSEGHRLMGQIKYQW